MSSSDTPFLLYKIECPICKTINEFELVRVGAFVEEGRDTDFCPQNVKWRFPRYQAYHPLVFFTATCSNCFYTRELTNEYKDWKNDANYRTYRLKSTKEKHLELLSQPDSFIRKAGASIDVPRYPNESGILKLLIAIHDEMLYEYPSHLDAGRFYLRIGWIFRAMTMQENPNSVMIRSVMQELSSRFAALQSDIQQIGTDLPAFARQIAVSMDIEQLPAPLRAQLLSYRDRFETELSSLDAPVRGITDRVNALAQLVEECRSSVLGGEQGGTTGFGKFNSFDSFLQELRKKWDGVVFSEREALKKAIYHYQEAFAGGRDIAPGNQQLQATYLIAELSRRVGRHEEARSYFTNTIKNGQEFIHANRNDQTRTALARKILELAIEQGKLNLAAVQKVSVA